MLNYTGHPLIDVGVATITAFAEKDDPTELTEADLDKIADYLIYEYTHQPLKSFATVPFAGGAYFTQPAYKDKPLEIEGTRKILTAYKASVSKLSEQCIFTGKPAVAITLDEGTLPPGRAARSNIPLITGATIINFHPYGEVGVPVSGEALLAIHAMPLGSAKCGGRLLMVHSDNRELMVHFAREFLKQNQQAINLARTEGSTKIKEADYSYRTLLIDTLIPATKKQGQAVKEEQPFSITAYHLSNSGQDPSLNLYHLPMQMLGFLREMQKAEYQRGWNQIVNRAWDQPQKDKKIKQEAGPFKHYRNFLYEDLFDLPDQASHFIRTYFLRVALRYAKNIPTDPRGDYSPQTEAELVSWKITAQFLRRIMHMDKQKVEIIKQMGDDLAEYVRRQNDKSFFRGFFKENRSYGNLRTLLLRVNRASTNSGYPPVIKFDSYITVFEDVEGLGNPDWRLARDLVLIRMIEQLYELGWFAQNPDAMPQEETDDTNQDQE